MTQNEKLINYMWKHDGITPMEALHELDIIGLPDRLDELKKEGYKFHEKKEFHFNKNGQKIIRTRYLLTKKQKNHTKGIRETYMKNYRKHLCIYCHNVYSGCPYSVDGTPVEGWTAELHHYDHYDSYAVTDCPMFKYDGQCATCIHRDKSINGTSVDTCERFRPYHRTKNYKDYTTCEHNCIKNATCKENGCTCFKKLDGCKDFMPKWRIRTRYENDRCDGYERDTSIEVTLNLDGMDALAKAIEDERKKNGETA